MENWCQRELDVATEGRGTIEITRQVRGVVDGFGIRTGLCHIFIRHTSASLAICECADPSVLRDLESFVAKLVPDGSMYDHDAEGIDDMPAHIRSVLTQTSITVPIANERLALGTWQGIFLWEHRFRPHHRRVIVTAHGTP